MMMYWNVHAESVTLGRDHQTPEEAAERTLGYLARYASGVALSNQRLLAIEGDDVVFTYKDYRDRGRRKTARVPGVELLDRFLLHVLPPGLRHIRHYGFLAPNRRSKRLPTIRALLGCAAPDADGPGEGGESSEPKDAPELRCPHCRAGVLVLDAEWPRPTVAEIMRRTPGGSHPFRLPFT